MSQIITKFSIGSAPLWLDGTKIKNKNRKFTIKKMYITKAANYCNVVYELTGGMTDKDKLMHEDDLFQTVEEIKSAIK